MSVWERTSPGHKYTKFSCDMKYCASTARPLMYRALFIIVGFIICQMARIRKSEIMLWSKLIGTTWILVHTSGFLLITKSNFWNTMCCRRRKRNLKLGGVINRPMFNRNQCHHSVEFNSSELIRFCFTISLYRQEEDYGTSKSGFTLRTRKGYLHAPIQSFGRNLAQ